MNHSGRTDAEIAAIIADYKSSVFVDTICATYHIGTHTLYDILDAADVRRRGGGNGSPRIVPELQGLLLTTQQIAMPGRGLWSLDHTLAIAQDREARAAMDVAETVARGKARVLVECVEAYAAARREAGIV